MAELKIPFFDFRSGVISLKLKDRTNLELNKSGVIVGENWLTQLHGPTNFRPGFIYSRPTRRNNRAWFIPFVFDDDESYCLEFTEGYMRIHSDEGIVVETAKAITGASQAIACVITATAHGYATGDEVYIDNIGGMTELNGAFYLVTWLNANTFSISDLDGNDIDSRLFDAYTAGGESSRVYEIPSPYLENDLRRVKYAQKADIMYLDHPSYIPRKLSRAAITSWTLASYTRTADPFGQGAITGITAANPGVVTCTAHGFVNGDIVLIEEVAGMTEVNGIEFVVTKLTNDTFSIVNTAGYTAYTGGGVCMLSGNAPATVGFYGGRLFHGGCNNDPDIIYGSRSSDPTTGATRYDDFTVGADADHAVIYALTPAGNSAIDRIRFFVGTRQFLGVGTYSGMLKVNGGSDSIPIAGNAIESFPVDAYGVADMMPISFGTDILYVQRGGEILSSFKYSILNDGFESSDETVQSDEIIKSGILQLAYVQGKPNRIWICTEDGKLLSLLYNRTEGLSAWNDHSLAANGAVLSICGEPQDDKEARLWCITERVINGVLRRSVEFMAKNPRIPERDDIYTGDTSAHKTIDDGVYNNLLFESQKKQIHLDCAMVLDTTQDTTIQPAATTGDDIEFIAGVEIFSAADVGRRIIPKYITGLEDGVAEIVSVTDGFTVRCNILKDFWTDDIIPAGEWYLTQDTVSGITHLEGEYVTVVADGGMETDKQVIGGSIELDGQATYVIVGKRYYGRLKTVPLEILLSAGITPGRDKTVNNLNIMFRNAGGVSYGYDSYNLQMIPFRIGGQSLDRPARLFNGCKHLPGFDIWDNQRSVWIIQTMPYPCTVNGLIADVETEF